MANIMVNQRTNWASTGKLISSVDNSPVYVWVTGEFDGASVTFQISPDNQHFIDVSTAGTITEPGSLQIAGGVYVRCVVANAGPNTNLSAIC